MAPCLKSIYNVSGKNVYINIDGSSFVIDNDESVSIGISITTDGYLKIDIGNSEDVKGYLLRYEDYKIMINDGLGKQKGVADCPVHTKYSDLDIKIQIFASCMHISCNGNYLGIYHEDGIVYYRSVVVRHKIGGGVIVEGGENNEAGAEDVEEASA